MKLFYSPGACSLSPHIALREAERRFELDRVDLKTHRTASGADYLAINPKGYVPALELDGPGSAILTEGPAIVQYIADLAPERRLAPPNGTFARYHLQEWLNFIATELHKQFGPLFVAESPAATVAGARDKLARRFAYVDSVLGAQPFVMGERFTVADGYLFVMTRWCERFAIDIKPWPNLARHLHDVARRPAVRAAMAAEGLLDARARRTA